MLKVIVCGAAGKMGRRICSIVLEDENLELAGAVEAKGSKFVGKDIGLVCSSEPVNLNIVDDLGVVIDKGNVVIDFTTPEATVEHVRVAADKDKPIVIGTTGLNGEQVKEIEKFSAIVPIVFAPNMSLGVNILFKLVGDIARVLGESYDVEIVEMHHRYKVDAPSGTALKLAEYAAEGLGVNLEEAGVFGRKGRIGERKPKEIGVMSLRGGDVVGEHTVIFAGLGERIELTHRASSRDTFARGAIKAARWVVDKVPGLYSMLDVLGLK